MVINIIGNLAEAPFHHTDLIVYYAFVIAKLMNQATEGGF